MRHVTVVVADHQPLYRRGVRWSLEREGDAFVVGEAGDGPTAISLIERHAPAVALLQSDLPGLNGAEVSRRVGHRLPGVRTILVVAEETDEQRAVALDAGAWEVVAKGVDADELVAVVRRVAGRDRQALEAAPRGGPAPVPGDSAGIALARLAPGALPAPLSARELRILDLIARGESNREIAGSLAVSEQTVKNAVSSILRKLGVGDRTQAVIAALRSGWVTLSES